MQILRNRLILMNKWFAGCDNVKLFELHKNQCAWLLWHWSSRGQLLQSTRLGLVGSKFNRQSEDQCQCFYPTLVMQIQPLNSLKIVSKVGHFSSTITMTAHCFGVLSRVRVIEHCVIGQQRDLLWPDWPNRWVWPWDSAFEIQIFFAS